MTGNKICLNPYDWQKVTVWWTTHFGQLASFFLTKEKKKRPVVKYPNC